jgi:hypothetical protein
MDITLGRFATDGSRRSIPDAPSMSKVSIATHFVLPGHMPDMHVTSVFRNPQPV